MWVWIVVSLFLSLLALVHNNMKVPKKWISSVSPELMQYLLVSLSWGKVIVRYWAADKQCITSTVFKETGLPSPHSLAKQEWINKWKQLHLLNSQELKRGQQIKLIQTNTKGNFSMMINYYSSDCDKRTWYVHNVAGLSHWAYKQIPTQKKMGFFLVINK